MGCKVLRRLGFSTVRAASQLKVSAGLSALWPMVKAISFFTNSWLCPSGTQCPPTAAHGWFSWGSLKSSQAAAVGSIKDPLSFSSTSSSGKGARAVCARSGFSPGVPLGSQQAGTRGLPQPAAGAGWLRHQSCTSGSRPFLKCFLPNPNTFQKRSGKTQRKALLSTYTNSLTTPLHAPPFSQVQFFHTIDDFTGSVRSHLVLFFFISWRMLSVSCQGWSALLLTPVGTTAPLSDAVSPLVHMVEADVTAPELKPCSQSVTALCGNGKIFSFSLLTILQTVTDDSQLSSCNPTALHNHRMSGLHTRISEQLRQTDFQMVTSQAA